MQGWNEDDGGQDDVFQQAQQLARQRMGLNNNSQGSQPNQYGNAQQPSSTNAFSQHAYSQSQSGQYQGQNQNYGSYNGISNQGIDQNYSEPTAKRQRQYNDGLSDLWNQSHGSQNQDSGLGGNVPQNRPTSSDVFVFSRPMQGQQQQQVQQQQFRQPQPQQQQQQQQNQRGNTPIQNLLQNIQNMGSGPNSSAMALAQLLLAAQPNSGFQGSRDLQMRVMQNNLANAANRRVEGLHGGGIGGLGRNLQQSSGYGSLGNLGGIGGGSQGSGGGSSLGNNSFMNMMQSNQNSAPAPAPAPTPAPAPMPEAIAPLPMMGDLLQQRQQAVEAQQEAAPAEPEPEEDKEEDILDKVGKISEKLRSMLGKDVTDRFSGTSDEAAGSSTMTQPYVKRDNLIEACGDAARTLKSYQLVGINFLMMLHKSESVGGAILADEMGLGKTAQTISFLGVLRTLCGVRTPHLVICPASLIQNWAREFKHWCPGMRVLMYHGKEREGVRTAVQRWRKKVLEARKDGFIDKLPPGMLVQPSEEEQEEKVSLDPDLQDEDYFEDHIAAAEYDDTRPVGGLMLPSETSGEAAFDIMITTYTLFEREGGYKADRTFMQKWKWAYLVADEAHALKNRSSIRTRKLRKLGQSCENRILLTGTPLQNSLEELRALLEFLMPSLFIEPGHENEDDTIAMKKLDDDEQAARVERYKALLAPFILRRLKSEVATQLMPKKHVVEEITMTPMQNKLYKAAVEKMRHEVALATTADTSSRSGGRGRGRGRKGLPPVVATGTDPNALVSRLGSQRVNNIFTHLRKVANHPLLIRSVFDDDKVAKMAEVASSHGLYGGNCTYERVHKELLGYSDHQLHHFASSWPNQLADYILDPAALMVSGKVKCLDELMPKLFAAGSKVLLFSQWTMTLDLLEWYMRVKGFSYVRLDGSTNVEDRLTIVDKFNDLSQNVFVFLLSTRAGGQGLNLTGADVVVLHDVDFNPQVDRQAEDRCHRLGQTKPVTVYRLVTKGTVDQNVLSIAERKLALDAAVLNDVTISVDGDDGDKAKTEAGDTGDPVDTTGKPGRKKIDVKEVRQMGAILSALLSGDE